MQFSLHYYKKEIRYQVNQTVLLLCLAIKSYHIKKRRLSNYPPSTFAKLRYPGRGLNLHLQIIVSNVCPRSGGTTMQAQKPGLYRNNSSDQLHYVLCDQTYKTKFASIIS